MANFVQWGEKCPAFQWIHQCHSFIDCLLLHFSNDDEDFPGQEMYKP